MDKIKVFTVYTQKIGTTTHRTDNFKSMSMAKDFAEKIKQNNIWRVVHIDSGLIIIHESIGEAINQMDKLS